MRKKWEVSKLGLSFVPSGRKLAFHISPLGVTAASDDCVCLRMLLLSGFFLWSIVGVFFTVITAAVF